jgi:hypothetical protein
MDHLSSSQIKLYLMCGLKYKFQYIDCLPRLFQASALSFGSVLHSTLAWFHDQKLRKREVSREMLFRIFDADWYNQKVEADIRYKDGEKEMTLVGLGKEFLDAYVKDFATEVKGAEVPFTVPLVSISTGETLDVNLKGFLDLVEADETIVEFKTSAQALSLSDIETMIQLTAYSYAYEMLNHRPPRALKVVNFIKNKKPRIEVAETRREKPAYEGFFFLAKGVLNGIRSESFVPRPGFWCKECEYRTLCPLWQGEEKHVAPVESTYNQPQSQ